MVYNHHIAIYVYKELLNKKPLELLLEANTDDLLQKDISTDSFSSKSILNVFRFWDSKKSTTIELKNQITLLLN